MRGRRAVDDAEGQGSRITRLRKVLTLDENNLAAAERDSDLPTDQQSARLSQAIEVKLNHVQEPSERPDCCAKLQPRAASTTRAKALSRCFPNRAERRAEPGGCRARRQQTVADDVIAAYRARSAAEGQGTRAPMRSGCASRVLVEEVVDRRRSRNTAQSTITSRKKSRCRARTALPSPSVGELLEVQEAPVTDEPGSISTTSPACMRASSATPQARSRPTRPCSKTARRRRGA
jgi:hypothetical protein